MRIKYELVRFANHCILSYLCHDFDKKKDTNLNHSKQKGKDARMHMEKEWITYRQLTTGLWREEGEEGKGEKYINTKRKQNE